MQVGKRALHASAVGAQAGAVLDTPAGDQRLHTETPAQSAVLVVVVATIAHHHVRAEPGPPSLAPRRRNRFEQRDELSDIVAGAAGQGAASGMPVASLSPCTSPGAAPGTAPGLGV